jgi:hypothetical protein
MIKNVSLTKENIIAAKLTVMALSKNDITKELVSTITKC